MRQSHQKSRSRGRGRKPQNPLSRNYESNGPDVKIRGNAGHIAEKYSSLARDALSNGDTVMAENYLQHAEHYNRLIAAAQAQRAEEQQNNAAANGKGPQPNVEDQDSGGNAALESEFVADNAPQNVAADEASDGEQKRERKSTRGRRTRKAPVADASPAEEAAADGGMNGHSVNGSDSQRNAEANEKEPGETVVEKPAPAEPVIAEAITEDAATLPGSIIGAGTEEA